MTRSPVPSSEEARTSASASTSRFGVGLWFGFGSALIAASLWLIDRWVGPGAAMTGINETFRVAVGWVLMIAGASIYAWTMVYLLPALDRSRLVTRGPYAWVRHPDYGSGVYLMAPGVVLWWGSWVMVALPFLMWLLLAALIDREERRLIERHGEAYRDYQRRVGRLWPRGRRGA